MTAHSTSPAQRLLMVLDLLIEVEGDVVRRPKGVSVQQAADQIGVHRSAANRIMNELLGAGYAAPNPTGKGYRVGPAVQIHQGLTVEQRHLAVWHTPTSSVSSSGPANVRTRRSPPARG